MFKGPVVRITPNEVHLSDVENYDKIYYMGSRYYKSPDFYNAFCIPGALFSTIPNDVCPEEFCRAQIEFSAIDTFRYGVGTQSQALCA